ncbi:MAG: YicC/YloC family endoribonuclease [Legionella sp.]
MTQSMTAFARVQKELDTGQLCWEIRSVNHRYLDVSFRLPETFRFIEPQLRAALRDKISRGKLECQLKYQDTRADNQSMLINMGMINALVDSANQLSCSHQLANDLSVSHVLSWPGVVGCGTVNMDDLVGQVLALFDEAVVLLGDARAGEGAVLASLVEGHLNHLAAEVVHAKTLVSSLAEHAKDKLLTRLHAVQLEVAEARVEQEIALLLTRLDVTEELERLDTHVNEVRRIVHSGQVAGRRLDFLMQELNREANTLSAKSDSVALTQSAVEMKVLIEHMREQIQNIE